MEKKTRYETMSRDIIAEATEKKTTLSDNAERKQGSVLDWYSEIKVRKAVKELKEKKEIHKIIVAYKNGEIDIYEMDQLIDKEILRIFGEALV